MLERLQAESSTCMYSEQGLEPLIRAVFEQVCQSLIVVSNCMPGSPHSQAACEIARRTSAALTVSMTLAGGDGVQLPGLAVDGGAHELVGGAHGVVGVLELDARPRLRR